MPDISNTFDASPLHHEVKQSRLIIIREILEAEIPVLLVYRGIVEHMMTREAIATIIIQPHIKAIICQVKSERMRPINTDHRS
jgi:hypothetical protein